MAPGLKWFGAEAKAVVLRELDRMMREAGQAWAERARELAPVKTGKLRDSIGFIYNNSKRELILYADVSYAAFVEWGSRFARAHPFMRPALSVIPRIFRGSSTLQFTNLAEPHHEKTANFAKGKTRGAKILTGHRKRK